ncbi:MAG: (d)CMP kinase [Anaerolineae bacterium]
MQPLIIAIDGPAAAGKSTVGKLLAERLNYLYFDTGVMYRAVTLAALGCQTPISDEIAITRLACSLNIDVQKAKGFGGRGLIVLCDGRDVTAELYSPEVDKYVPRVSAYPMVRAELTKQQRRIGERGNVIMTGRDIGTVVLPNADLKIYLDAAIDERARRRLNERNIKSASSTFEQLREDILRRDSIDLTRTTAPLSRAPDAFYLDNTGLTIEETVEKIMRLILK